LHISQLFLHNAFSNHEETVEDLKKVAGLGNNDAQSYLGEKAIQW